MDLQTYQQHALRTALPTALSRDYLVPMIVGEVGELFGKEAKAHRDGWHIQQLEDELISEYGDIAWGTAVLLHVEGVPVIERSVPDYIMDRMAQLLQQVGDMYDTHLYMPETLKYEAAYLWKLLEKHCQAITNESFAQVLQANVDKLAGRAQRGTVQGSGDNR